MKGPIIGGRVPLERGSLAVYHNLVRRTFSGPADFTPPAGVFFPMFSAEGYLPPPLMGPG